MKKLKSIFSEVSSGVVSKIVELCAKLGNNYIGECLLGFKTYWCSQYKHIARYAPTLSLKTSNKQKPGEAPSR